jgi:hypothetical protein
VKGPGWYFDHAAGELVYVPAQAAHLDMAGAGTLRLHFRVRVDFRPRPGGPAGQMDVAGATIISTAPYSWFKNP